MSLASAAQVQANPVVGSGVGWVGANPTDEKHPVQSTQANWHTYQCHERGCSQQMTANWVGSQQSCLCGMGGLKNERPNKLANQVGQPASFFRSSSTVALTSKIKYKVCLPSLEGIVQTWRTSGGFRICARSTNPAEIMMSLCTDLKVHDVLATQPEN